MEAAEGDCRVRNVTVSQILDSISKLTGVPPPKMATPYPAALVASFFAELIVTRIFGQPSGFPSRLADLIPERLPSPSAKSLPAPALEFSMASRKVEHDFHRKEEMHLKILLLSPPSGSPFPETDELPR